MAAPGRADDVIAKLDRAGGLRRGCIVLGPVAPLRERRVGSCRAACGVGVGWSTSAYVRGGSTPRGRTGKCEAVHRNACTHRGQHPPRTRRVTNVWEVHTSHRKMLLRNILFCRTCGYWSSKKTQKLSEACILAPPHSDGRAKLKRMMDGYHPDRGIKAWNDGLSTAIKVKPISLDH